MSFIRTHLILPGTLLLAAVPHVTYAQQAAPELPYAPVMAQFGGQGGLLLPPMPALDISNYGTIEFWVATRWTANPGYDPAVMALTGPKGARFAVLISGDRQALGVWAGANYAAVPFDFSDNAQHHVAMIVIADSITVMIDGEIIGTLPYGIADLPANRFSVAAMGRFSPFIGDIGQVRIWDEAIDPDVLVHFAARPLAATGPRANPETGGFIFAGDPDDPDLATAPLDPIDDSDLGLAPGQ
jgi:hypothetical protein